MNGKPWILNLNLVRGCKTIYGFGRIKETRVESALRMISHQHTTMRFSDVVWDVSGISSNLSAVRFVYRLVI
jgi:hypothetical protein